MRQLLHWWLARWPRFMVVGTITAVFSSVLLNVAIMVIQTVMLRRDINWTPDGSFILAGAGAIWVIEFIVDKVLPQRKTHGEYEEGYTEHDGAVSVGDDGELLYDDNTFDAPVQFTEKHKGDVYKDIPPPNQNASHTRMTR